MTAGRPVQHSTNDKCVADVMDYLATADLKCTAPQLSDALGLEFHVIAYRLRARGTNWGELKRVERLCRLRRMLAEGADLKALCTGLGLTPMACRSFFRQHYGMSLTEYRKGAAAYGA